MNKPKTLYRLVTVLLILTLTVSALCLNSLTVLGAGQTNNAKSSLVLSPLGTGSFKYVIAGEEGISSTRFSLSSFTNGYEIVLEAIETADTFMYWLDKNTNRVVSFSKDYTFTLASNTYLYAVFASHTDANHNVVYLNYAGVELINREVALGTSINAPSDMYLPGFTFVGWDKTPYEVRTDTDFIIAKPIYTLNSASYTVTLTNSANVSGAGNYNLLDTVKITADKTNAAGDAFSYWKDADNLIVSYDPVYKFKINYNATFTAVYGESVTPEPVTRIIWVDSGTDKGRVTFFSERSVPEGFEVLQHGILITSDASIAQGTNFTVKNTSALIFRGKGTTVEKLGLYSLAKKGVEDGSTWYARSYIICNNGTSQRVYYSGVHSQLYTTSGGTTTTTTIPDNY